MTKSDTITIIITSIVSISGAALSWAKWWKPRVIEKTSIYKAIEGNRDIDLVLEKLNIELQPNAVKCGIIETTNGGGIPMAGHVTYKRVIASTDGTVFRMFGQKTPNDKSYNEIIFQTLKRGEYMWSVKDMEDPQIVDFMSVSGITNGCVHLIGIESGIRLLALVVDFKNNYIPNAKEKNMIREAKADLCKILGKTNKNIQM